MVSPVGRRFGELDDPGNFEPAVGNVYPEMRRYRLPQAEHHADDADIADPIVTISYVTW